MPLVSCKSCEARSAFALLKDLRMTLGILYPKWKRKNYMHLYLTIKLPLQPFFKSNVSTLDWLSCDPCLFHWVLLLSLLQCFIADEQLVSVNIVYCLDQLFINLYNFLFPGWTGFWGLCRPFPSSGKARAMTGSTESAISIPFLCSSSSPSSSAQVRLSSIRIDSKGKWLLFSVS